MLFPGRYPWLPRTELEKGFRETLIQDLAKVEAVTSDIKDRFTLGLYSSVERDGDFRVALEQYAESAFGERVVVADDGVENNPSPPMSDFRPLWDFPLLYKGACQLSYIVPIHQQLVESFFFEV